MDIEKARILLADDEDNILLYLKTLLRAYHKIKLTIKRAGQGVATPCLLQHGKVIFWRSLSKAGCEVVGQAHDGREVLELYREKRPDMVIMDINMPFQTGEETLAQLKNEFPEALVIMLTSVADTESVERCLQLGAARYLRKDTPMEEMRSLILDTWLEHQS